MSLALRDREDYEIIRGQIFMFARPSMKHVSISGNVYAIFKSFLRGKTCKAYIEPDLFMDNDNNFIPDVVILCDRDKLKPDGIYGAPDLVVEVLSPSTAKRDKTEKKDIYGQYGVREYWTIQPESKEITVYQNHNGLLEISNIYYHRTEEELNHMKEEDRKAIVPSLKVSILEGFEISLAEVFEDLEQ